MENIEIKDHPLWEAIINKAEEGIALMKTIQLEKKDQQNIDETYTNHKDEQTTCSKVEKEEFKIPTVNVRPNLKKCERKRIKLRQKLVDLYIKYKRTTAKRQKLENEIRKLHKDLILKGYM